MAVHGRSGAVRASPAAGLRRPGAKLSSVLHVQPGSSSSSPGQLMLGDAPETGRREVFAAMRKRPCRSPSGSVRRRLARGLLNIAAHHLMLTEQQRRSRIGNIVQYACRDRSSFSKKHRGRLLWELPKICSSAVTGGEQVEGGETIVRPGAGARDIGGVLVANQHHG